MLFSLQLLHLNQVFTLYGKCLPQCAGVVPSPYVDPLSVYMIECFNMAASREKLIISAQKQ